GEAPSRTIELSEEVSRLRQDVAARLDQPRPAGGLGVSPSFPSRVGGWEEGPSAKQNRGTERREGHEGGVDAVAGSDAIRWVAGECNLPAEAAEQLVRYIRAERDGIGLVPTQQDVVFERFFDESGGMQLVVHAPFGGRINRAWGLALRKRFCVGFDFELQAAASDDAMLLSIGANNSFPLTDMFDLVKPQWVEEAVEQSLLVSPMFGARWRWNATRALAILRQRQGKKVPPQIQRMRADDLMAAVFPKLVGCQENQTGPIEIPDHPIVRPDPRDPEELHEALLSLIAVRPEDSRDWETWFDELVSSGRAAIADTGGGPMWFAAENLPAIQALYPSATIRPELRLPPDLASRAVNEDDARLSLFRGHMEFAGPVKIAELTARTSMPLAAANSVL